MVEHDVVGSRMERCAFLVHLRDSVHLIGMVNGAAHQPQGGHAAARRLDLGED